VVTGGAAQRDPELGQWRVGDHEQLGCADECAAGQQHQARWLEIAGGDRRLFEFVVYVIHIYKELPMATKTERTGLITLFDDRGAAVVANVFTTFTEYKPLAGPSEWISGTKSVKLVDGSHLNPQSDDTFIEVSTSRVFRVAR
jgi:hypothetical protein